MVAPISPSLWFVMIGMAVAAVGILLIDWYTIANNDGELTLRAFAVLLSMLFIWTAGQAGRLLTASLGGKLIWQYVLYVGVAFVPVAWLVFILLYTGFGRYVDRRVIGGLAVVPVVNLLVLYTNTFHQLFYESTRLSYAGVTPILRSVAGPFWWVHFAYSYALIGLGMVLLVRFAVVTENLYRTQTAALVVAALLPLVANIIFLFGFLFDPVFDITPLTFALSSVLLFVAIFYGRFLDVVPVAYEAVVRTLDDGIIVVDDGEIVSANHKAASMLTDGRDAETLAGCTLSELEPTLSMIPEERTIASSSAGVDRGFEAASVSGGKTEWFWVRRVDLLTATNNRGSVVTLTDITDKKRFERQLRKLQATHQQLIVASDEAAIIRIAVDAAKDVLGLPVTGVWKYDEERSVLQPMGMTDEAHETLTTQPTFQRGESLAWDAFTDGELKMYSDISEAGTVHNPETPLRSEIIAPIGDWGVMASGSTTSTEFRNTDFDLLRVLTTAVENAVTRMERERKLRERERELSRQNNRLEEFTSVVSHDLRSPLNQATMSLELATEDIDDERLETAKNANERAIEMVEDLLALARQGKTVESTERQQVETTVQQAWASTPTPEATLEIVDSLGRVAADHSRLRQAFENLFRNAIEHGGASVRVRVGSLDAGGIYIADDGPGIPEEMRDDVFEHGYTTAGAGTGFGLAIVNRVVEAHGWSICVTESADGGARFEMTGLDRSPGTPESRVEN